MNQGHKNHRGEQSKAVSENAQHSCLTSRHSTRGQHREAKKREGL